MNLIKAAPFGLQHILAMFVANITPIIIIAGVCGMDASNTALIIQSAMIITGIGTLIQLFPIWRIGSRLPIVMGISFTFVSLACAIGGQYGYGTIMGAVLGGCTIMMFGTIVVSGLQMIGKCGFSQRNITIAALSLSVGLGFTQCPDMFAIFPSIVETVFAENCVAVVFITAIVLNLVLPKDKVEEK